MATTLSVVSMTWDLSCLSSFNALNSSLVMLDLEVQEHFRTTVILDSSFSASLGYISGTLPPLQ